MKIENDPFLIASRYSAQELQECFHLPDFDRFCPVVWLVFTVPILSPQNQQFYFWIQFGYIQRKPDHNIITARCPLQQARAGSFLQISQKRRSANQQNKLKLSKVPLYMFTDKGQDL